jgi:hypothetical protein
MALRSPQSLHVQPFPRRRCFDPRRGSRCSQRDRCNCRPCDADADCDQKRRRSVSAQRRPDRGNRHDDHAAHTGREVGRGRSSGSAVAVLSATGEGSHLTKHLAARLPPCARGHLGFENPCRAGRTRPGQRCSGWCCTRQVLLQHSAMKFTESLDKLECLATSRYFGGSTTSRAAQPVG